MRTLCVWVLCAACVPAATLEQLSLDDLIRKSTTIVRGRIDPSYTENRRSILYTHYTVQVSERWKGPAGVRVDIAVPGGQLGTLRQQFPGSPRLEPGHQYLLFLWTSRGGLTQVIGLSQGLFAVSQDPGGAVLVNRDISTEPMLDAQGRDVQDRPLSMKLQDLHDLVVRTLDGGR